MAVEVGPPAPRDLSAFADKRKISWDERLELIKRVFPSCDNMDWKKAFDRDIDLAGRIVKDIIKADQATPGRPGPRPALDTARATPMVDRLLGRDPNERPYTVLPFDEAFTMLVGDHSLRQVSRKVGLAHVTVHRLIRGEIVPTGEMMERIAEAFGKRPSYFLEYRIGAIAASVMQKLVGSPEKTIRAYEALWHEAAAEP